MVRPGRLEEDPTQQHEALPLDIEVTAPQQGPGACEAIAPQEVRTLTEVVQHHEEQ